MRRTAGSAQGQTTVDAEADLLDDLIRRDGVGAVLAVWFRTAFVREDLRLIGEHPWLELDVPALMAFIRRVAKIADAHWCEDDRWYRDTAAEVLALEPPLRWTVEQVAEQVGLSFRTVQQYAEQMGGAKMGKRWYFSPECVRDWQRLQRLRGRKRLAEHE